MERHTKKWMVAMGLLVWLIAGNLLTLITNVRGEEKAPPPPPPADYVISNMETTGSVTGDLGHFKTTVSFTVLQDGWRSIPAFPLAASLTSFKIKRGDSRNIMLQRQRDNYTFLVGKKGDYQVEIEHSARIRTEKLGKSLTVFFLPAANASVKLTLPLKDAKVSVYPDINFGVTDKDKITEVLLFNTVQPEVTVSWSAVEAERPFVPTYFAEQKTIYTVSKGSLRIDSVIDYNILLGELDRFEIALSDDLNIIDVTGDKIKKWDTRNDEKSGKILAVETTSGITKSFSVRLVLEKTLDALPINFSAPKIEPLGVQREKGFIALAAKKGLRVEPVTLENIVQIDIQDLPFDTRGSGLTLALKYLKRPFTLMLKADEIPPKVFADIMAMSRVSKDSIRLDTHIIYTIREAGVFHFKIKLPEGLKIIDLEGENINNWQIKDNILTVDLRSQAEGNYRLVLLTEKTIDSSGEVPFPIIQTLETEREQGYLAVSALSGVKVDLASAKDITQINIRDFPFMIPKSESDKLQPPPGSRVAPIPAPQEQSVAGEPQSYPDLAFRYLKHPYEIQLNIKDIKPEVNAELQTVMTIDERKLELVSDIIYDIRKAGVFSLKLHLPKTLHITDLKGQYVDDWRYNESTETLAVTLATRMEGTYRLQLKAEAMLSEIEKGVSIPKLQALDVAKERGFIALSVDSALRVKTDSSDFSKLIEIDLKDLPAAMNKSNLTLAYKYYEGGWTLGLSVEKIKSNITVETFQFVSIGESLIHTSATLKYDIQFAGASKFKFRFPQNAKNIDIKGENIKHKGKTAEDESVWTVELHSPRQGAYYLYVTFQTEMKKSEQKYEPMKYTGLQVEEVERETGYLALAARADMELSDPKPENLTPLDEKEIPAGYKVGIDYPILMAFRYLKHPYEISANVNQHEFSEVLVAIIEACRLATTISENGQLITDLTCRIRNTREQYLRLSLPEKTNIWHVQVAGVNESSFKTTENGRDIILIPIAQQSKTDNAFTVNIRYAYEVKQLGSSGIIDLTCPRMNIPVMRLGWSVSIPDKYQIVMNAGNMERVNYFEPLIEQLGAGEQTRENQPPPQTANPPPQDMQLKTQNEANLAAVENIRHISGKGGEIDTTSGKATGLPSMYTGTIPTTVNTYYYQTLISLDLSGNIYAHYLKKGFSNILTGLLAILAALMTVLFWLKSRKDAVRKIAVIIVGILVILAVSTLIGQSYQNFFAVLIWVPALIAVAITLTIGLREYLLPYLTPKPQTDGFQPAKKNISDKNKEPEDPLEETR